MEGLQVVPIEKLLSGINVRLGALGVPAGQLLSGIMPGDTVRVIGTIQYRGPQYTDAFYAAIGVWRGITWPVDIGNFDEIWAASISVSFAASYDWVTYPLQVDIQITEVGLTPWTPGLFDLYSKLNNAGIYTPRIDNKIEVILQSGYQSFSIVSYEKV